MKTLIYAIRFLARSKAFSHFVLLRILTTDGERNTDGLVTAYFINPLSACSLIEVS